MQKEHTQSQTTEDDEARPTQRTGGHDRLHAEEDEHEDHEERMNNSPVVAKQGEPLPTAQPTFEFKRHICHRHACLFILAPELLAIKQALKKRSEITGQLANRRRPGLAL